MTHSRTGRGWRNATWALVTAGAVLGTAQANFSPRDVFGTSIWLDAADVRGNGSKPADGTALSVWTNKAGTFHATQGTSNRRPVVKSGEQNQRDVVRFTRISSTSPQYLEFNNAAVGTLLNVDNTLFAVARANAGGGDNVSNSSQLIVGRPGWDWAAASCLRFVGHPEANRLDAVQRLGVGQWGPNDTTWTSLPYTQGQFVLASKVVQGRYDPPSSVDLSVPGQGTVLASNTTYGLWDHGASLNYLRLGGNAGRYDQLLASCAHGLSGDIAEVLFYNRMLAPYQRQKIEGYLAWKWGMTGSLPSEHPWKSTAPDVIAGFYTTSDGQPTKANPLVTVGRLKQQDGSNAGLPQWNSGWTWSDAGVNFTFTMSVPDRTEVTITDWTVVCRNNTASTPFTCYLSVSGDTTANLGNKNTGSFPGSTSSRRPADFDSADLVLPKGSYTITVRVVYNNSDFRFMDDIILFGSAKVIHPGGTVVFIQ